MLQKLFSREGENNTQYKHFLRNAHRIKLFFPHVFVSLTIIPHPVHGKNRRPRDVYNKEYDFIAGVRE